MRQDGVWPSYKLSVLEKKQIEQQEQELQSLGLWPVGKPGVHERQRHAKITWEKEQATTTPLEEAVATAKDVIGAVIDSVPSVTFLAVSAGGTVLANLAIGSFLLLAS